MKYAIGVMLVGLCVGCSQRWPEGLEVDAAYQSHYQAWLAEQQETARESAIIVGIWPLPDGETAFGSDASLPIVLPATAAPRRAGVFRRNGDKVSVIPASGVTLLDDQDKPMTESSEIPYEMKLASLRLAVIPMPDGRQFVSVSDEEHPLLKDFPKVQTYPLEQRWRVSARFDAFEQPRMVKIADVRGGAMEVPSPGRLTFTIDDEEQQLTAFRFPDSDEFFVLFKDATNASTTYGY